MPLSKNCPKELRNRHVFSLPSHFMSVILRAGTKEQRSEVVQLKKRRLHYHLALPVTVIVVVLLLVNIAFSSSLQRKQAEDTMRDQAYILSQDMAAIWDFISVNQNRINYDRDGVYSQKGLYCSKAGLSVGALFSKRTDYVIGYAALNPRNEQNRADDFETEALVAFGNNPILNEYTAFGEMQGEEGRYFDTPPRCAWMTPARA
ncbi:MAG: DUF3365 domain-containing protein, partial [Raoultibacter sp.]